jgi:DNA-binding response OmpR family regulator
MKGELFRGRRVLVLEDEPIIAMLLAELIEAAGGDAERVSSLAAAALAMDRSTPDLAILDINIHNQTSFAIAERLDRLRVPFIFASGYGNKANPAGMEQVPTVTKPYDLRELEQALGAAISRQREA